MSERAILFTGIGGQGIQLAARTLAVAATHDGLHAMMFGEYGGVMRGGNSDATTVLGTGRLLSPPTVPTAWGAVVLHHAYWESTESRLAPGGLVIIDRSVFQGEIHRDDLIVLDIEATRTATDLGHMQAASMVALGAFAAAADLVALSALETASGEVLPAYRSEHAASNAAAVRAGHELVDSAVSAAWSDRQMEVAR